MNFEKFLRELFLQNISERLLIYVQVARSQDFQQILFKHFIQERESAIGRCSFNQNPWKLSVKKLIRSEINSSKFVVNCMMAARKFTMKTLSYTIFKYHTFIFPGRIKLTSSEEALKLCKLLFFLQEIWTKRKLFYQFNYDSLSLFSSFRVWHFDAFCLTIKLEFFVSCYTFLFYAKSRKKALQEYFIHAFPFSWYFFIWYILCNKSLITF